MAIEIKQTEDEVRKGWWKWSVHLDGPADEMERIERVVYYLHPTFPQPEREVTDRSTGFRLEASGWGTFELGIEIFDTTGASETLSHQLQFTRRDDPDWIPTKRSLEPEPPTKSATDPPRSVLLLGDLATAKTADELRRSLEALGVSVSDASSVKGSSWSKELVDSIRTYDGVIKVGSSGGSMPVEGQIAKKLGKQIIEVDLGPGASVSLDGKPLGGDSFDIGAVSRGIAGSLKLDG